MYSWRVSSVDQGLNFDLAELEKGGICANDTYEYKGQTYPAPISYDPKSGKFMTETKTFCSPNCSKRWLMKNGGSRWLYKCELLALLCRKHLGIKQRIKAAPPPDILERFTRGGWSIEKYRRFSDYNAPIQITTFPLILNPAISWTLNKSTPNARRVVRQSKPSVDKRKQRFESPSLSKFISSNKSIKK